MLWCFLTDCRTAEDVFVIAESLSSGRSVSVFTAADLRVAPLQPQRLIQCGRDAPRVLTPPLSHSQCVTTTNFLCREQSTGAARTTSVLNLHSYHKKKEKKKMKPISDPVSSQSTDIIDQVKGPYRRLSLTQNGGLIGLFSH